MQQAESLEKIKESILLEIPDVIAIYLFGSRAQESAVKESDYDISILLPPGKIMDDFKLSDLRLSLAVEINNDVDLICMNQATLVMQFVIISTGVLLFTKSLESILNYEALTFSMYQRFNEERKDLLEDITRSGKIYSP
jgi:predicted nucleotidyltransferase